jgi:hypothetical protein
MKVGSSYLKADCHAPLPIKGMPDQTIQVAKGLADGRGVHLLASRETKSPLDIASQDLYPSGYRDDEQFIITHKLIQPFTQFIENVNTLLSLGRYSQSK